MKHIIKAFSLISIMAVIPAAMAATSRVSMITRASPRLPSIAGYIASANKATTTASGTSYLADIDCLNNYSDCIKADDACGSDFEECTTNTLLHVHTPKCLNVLSQCTPAGMSSLFGTNNLSAISAYTTDDNEEKVYEYPTTGSALGQMVAAAQIANQLPLDQCVKKYTSCLKKDSVCGEDFELCTDNKEFKKQAVLCASTLARCKADGKKELFGDTAKAAALAPVEESRLGMMIREGAELAAVNAVRTCQRVVDNCLISACVQNPLRCVEGISMAQISAADFVSEVETSTGTTTGLPVIDTNMAAKMEKFSLSKAKKPLKTDEYIDLSALTTSKDVKKVFESQCMDTIGTNKYCHMTYREKENVKNKELYDVDLMKEVFTLAYDDRKAATNVKIQEELKKFDTNAKEACIDTITECAMRSCGGGIGSVCYTQSKGNSANGQVDITKNINDIKSGCAAIVNADKNCQYAATATSDAGYMYSYYDKDVFSTLFIRDSIASTSSKASPASKADPIGVVAYLNSLLATSYNEAAIENLRKQCQTTALSCVKSMCGKDYVNCYRNRTDIVIGDAGAYDTGASKFDKSMNKVGGVLDYNIVIGLCMNTIKNSPVCEEHLKIAANDIRGANNGANNKDENSWGINDKGDQYDSVRSGWLDANSTTTPNEEVLVACAISAEDAALKRNCKEGATMKLSEGQNNCIGLMDDDGCLYSVPVYQVYDEYILENAGKTLFQQLLADVEREVQAKYNAKLTKEQNVCYANNNGGVKGSNEHGSTFMWVKLKNDKGLEDYSQKGLSTKDFSETGDLYGAFCRAKITVMSDDKMIQDELGSKGTAYFAVGDSFNCGSWIDSKTLDKISRKVGERELCKQGYGKWDDTNGTCDASGLSTKEKVAYAWGTVAPALAGLGIGIGLTESGTISGLLNKANAKMTNTKTNETLKTQCLDYTSRARSAVSSNDPSLANSYATSALNICNQLYPDANNNPCPQEPAQAEGSTKTNSFVTLNGTENTVTNNQNEYKRSIKGLQDAVTGIAGADDTENEKTEYKSFVTVVKNAANATDPIQGNALANKAVELCKTIATKVQALPEAVCTYTPWVISGDTNATTTTHTIGDNLQQFNSSLNTIETACRGAADISEKDEKRNDIIRGVVPVATSLGAGALGAGITASIIQTKKENIQNEEAQKWMDEVGEHIRCYVGGEELGSYGDVISIEIN